MATNCTVRFPAAACAGFSNPRSALRTLLNEALGDSLEPASELPVGESVRVSIYLSSELAMQLRGVAKRTPRPLDEIAAGLVYARFLQRTLSTGVGRPEQDGSIKVDAVRSKGPTPGAKSHAVRQDGRIALQTRLRVPLMAGLHDERIVFAEGGTGLGKSRVIAQCSQEYLRDHPEAKVLVLAPTVSVLAHLVREFKEVVPADFDAFSVVLGRGQFVSSKRLESMLTIACPNPALSSNWQAAAAWLENGGRAADQSMGGFAREFSLCWLADELRRVAPLFPVDDVLLGRGDEGDASDPAQTAYQALRLRAFDEKIKIVFATQAMACLNVWSLLRPDRQRGILPPFDLILIDEAHELEEVMARAVGSSVSLLHMRQVLRQGLDQSTWQKFSLATAAHEALGHLDRAERLLQQFPSAGLINAWSDADATPTGGKRPFEKFLGVARDLDASLKIFAEFQDEAAN